MNNIKISIIFLIFSIISASVAAFTDHNNDEFEVRTSGGTMINLPIQIDLQGKITYGIGIMNHSGHGTSNPGHMNDMNDMGDMHDMSGMGDMNDMQDMDSMSDMGDMHGADDMHDMGDMNDSGHMGHSKNRSTIMWHIMPMLQIGGDYNKRIVSAHIQENPTQLLYPSSFHTNYISVINKRIETGAGLMLMGMPSQIDWGGFLQVGFMAYKGSSFFSKSNHKNYQRAEDARALSIPRSIQELRAWKISDKVVLSTHGGVMIGAGVGATIFTDLSVNYMAQGDWRIEIEKTSNTKLRVNLSETNMKHIMYNMGATVVSMNIGKHKVRNASFEYEIDLSKREALEVYNQLLQGDLRFAEKLLNSEIEGVKDLYSSNSSGLANMLNTKLGLPLLFNRNKMIMTSTTTQKVKNLQEDIVLNSEMTMVHKERNTDGILSAHKKDYSMYMGMKNQTGSFKYNTSSFVWHYERDRVSLKQLNKVLAKWNKSINSKKLLPFKAYTKKLGHARATVNLVFTEIGHNKLKELAKGNIKLLSKKMLNSPKKFKEVLNKIGKKNFHKSLQIQTEFFNKVVKSI
ncbi:MAG: hypothetical protein BM556_02345 [Bacteriovorax sp. MedPE-SWde]|nr:MAG: hypothetical protein BM556_02345 [Bacteriovorax sp. MedPE-SWde]